MILEQDKDTIQKYPIYYLSYLANGFRIKITDSSISMNSHELE